AREVSPGERPTHDLLLLRYMRPATSGPVVDDSPTEAGEHRPSAHNFIPSHPRGDVSPMSATKDLGGWTEDAAGTLRGMSGGGINVSKKRRDRSVGLTPAIIEALKR